MADSLSREERVAAGLKKLKQFQQRANRKRAKTSSKENSPVLSTENLSSKAAKSDDSKVVETGSSTNESPVSTSSPADSKESLEQNDVGFSTESTIKDSTSDSTKSFVNSSLSHNSASETEQKHLLISRSSESLECVGSTDQGLETTLLRDFSSTESIRQISQQVNGLMSETHALLNGSVEQDVSSIQKSRTLERRNQELAAQVDNLRQANEQLQYQLQEMKLKGSRQLKDFEQEKQELLEKSHKDQVALKDQLQVHIQTIGILVAEKTELQSSLSLSQQTAKQKAAEVEELHGRLRASRQRASDLERELNSLNTSHQQFEKDSKESSKEIDRLKLENYKMSKTNEELKQQVSELTEKLNRKINDCLSMENDLADARNKLSLSELYVQQLSQANSSENPSEVEELHLEKLELEKKVLLNKEAIDKLISERDQMSEQYQAYIQQLSQQVTSLRDELKQISDEKDALCKEKSVLQEKLEAAEKSSGMVDSDSLAELKLQITVLEKQKNGLSKDLEVQVSDNAQLSKLMQEQENKVLELESTIARLEEEKIDKARLLDTMQSDKVAASRAVAQNRELKKQLEELQTGFVTMSNDKLGLTEKLHAEQHITKELGERLSQQEEELQELRDQLSEKETQLQNLEKSKTKGMYQQSQIADRMRHYEAQGQLAETLQQELLQAQERINTLVNQNTELRMALARQAEVTSLSDASKEDKDAAKRNDLVASLSASVRQLEMERDQMMRQLEEQKNHRIKLDAQIKEKENELNQGSVGNGDDVVSQEEHKIMKNAMVQLEERFKQTMNQIAELADEKQQLEHLVTQLQGETDTIGDYIALYQIQRGLMRKRAAEKDDYISQLAKDRENLKVKLSQLQDLVVKLMDERKRYRMDGSLPLDVTSDEDAVSEIPSRAENLTVSKTEVDIPDVAVTAPSSDPSIKTEATAKKIIDLLTEIGNSNLIEKPVTDNFHPCPVCSGRLLTV